MSETKEEFQIGDLVKVCDYFYATENRDIKEYVYKLGLVVYISSDTNTSGEQLRWYRVMVKKDHTIERYHKDTYGPYDV